MKRKISKSDKFPIYRHTSKINGKTISRDIVDFSDISIIIAYESEKIIVISQNRFPNGTSIEIPSGLVEKGEKPIDAAFREFKEETGYEAKKMIPFFEFFSWMGYSTQKVHCFIAKDFKKISSINLDKNEIISPKKINFKSFLKLIKSGKIHEPCTITTAMIFAMKQKLI
mgnify:FL=1